MHGSDGKIECEGCGGRYYPALAWKHAGCVVVHSPKTGSPQALIGSPQASELVVHTESTGSPHVGSRHGVYRDAEARRRYKREWMARKRAKGV